MGQRKRLKSPKRQAEAKSVLEHSPAAAPAARQCYMFTLPDDIICDILEWTRPDDEDQFIWLWLCRISGTCKVLRRLVRLKTKGVARLMPTVFKVVDNGYYLKEGSHHRAPALKGSSKLQIRLMDTIRNSDWMGSNVRFFRFLSSRQKRRIRTAVAVASKNLLIAPCFPNLLDVGIESYPGEKFNFEDDSFLRGLARVHPSLRGLRFYMSLKNNPTQRETSLEAFAALSASMNCLQEVVIGVWDNGSDSDFPDQHLSAFLSNLNPSLTSLVLDFADSSILPGDEGFSNLLICCQDLISLTIKSDTITTATLARIIWSKKDLAFISLNLCNEDRDDHGVIDAIVQTKPPLEMFQVILVLLDRRQQHHSTCGKSNRSI